MDKQEQAQRFAEILLKTTYATHGHLSTLELENISETAYSLADYMQAEADKRIEKANLVMSDDERDSIIKEFFKPSALPRETHKNLDEFTMYPEYDASIDYPPDAWVMYGGEKRLAVSIKDEWQPDWSQAPANDVVAWKMKDESQPIWIAKDGGYYLAPSFDYKGDWQNSLRKRPQGI